MHTSTIVEKLRIAGIDMAILSTPLDDPKILGSTTLPRKFAAYISPTEPIYERTELSANDMPLDKLWVLEGVTVCAIRYSIFAMKSRNIITRMKPEV